MGEHEKIATSAEVYAVIYARHGEKLRAFSSYSAPDGDEFGDPNKCTMMTEWGFEGSDFPICGIETTWDKDHGTPHNRLNKENTYWLCVGREVDE